MDGTVSARALREAEELHRIILISTSEAVLITDDDGAFTYICPNVDVIFGCGPEEVRAMGRISQLFGRDPIDRAALAAAGELRNIEHDLTTRQGARRTLLVHVKQVAVQGGTTLYVCRDVTERKQAEHTLRRNEARLGLALEVGSIGTWDWHLPTGEMAWSPGMHRLLGDVAGAIIPSFETFLHVVHTEDRDRLRQLIAGAIARGASYDAEFRVVGQDEVERWVLGKGRPLRGGTPSRMVGVFVDLTERHSMQAELRDLGGRIVRSGEQERVRLARELHDGVVQRLSVVTAELGTLSISTGEDAASLRARIGELSKQTVAIGAELRRLSYDLHPSTVERMGVEKAIRTLCDDLAHRQRLAIHVDIRDLPQALPDDVALCLYRIAQEALQNVIRHSGAPSAKVSLVGSGAEVQLSVSDLGTGFDVQAAHHRASLGLVSMRERARLVNGQLALYSKIGEGTRVEARVPVAPKIRS
jgi:PAS domain S-box-containing protein